ncbi:hypothetical protein RchiOBHm_Chr3g0466031 [Rosa chinensis]|uniref:Uncharacterized protein n=1 Tax=Rosa chinensis TaxID=74649 RepID=A0A2P6R9W7_ROSCH|nr:hypothetical protein RchiOBHm_Chr3g0466031 [Rosa chinensis]
MRMHSSSDEDKCIALRCLIFGVSTICETIQIIRQALPIRIYFVLFLKASSLFSC